jgi:hypothetical protein
MKTNGNGSTVTTLSDDLIKKAQAIASRSDELLHLLEDARQALLDTDRKVAVTSRITTQAAAKKPAAKGQISDGLRLLTTQMSVEGSSREEIAERLQGEFGIRDPEPILRDMGL